MKNYDFGHRAKLPVEPNIRRSPKLQLLDTGLVNFAAGLQNEFFIAQNINDTYNGRIAEHITAQELLAMNSSVLYRLNYWTREETGTTAEVDFVILHNGLVVPVEVKSGATGKLRSLHQFVDGAPHPYAAWVFSGQLNITKEKSVNGKTFKLLNIPFYLTSKLPQYVDLLMNETKTQKGEG